MKKKKQSVRAEISQLLRKLEKALDKITKIYDYIPPPNEGMNRENYLLLLHKESEDGVSHLTVCSNCGKEYTPTYYAKPDYLGGGMKLHRVYSLFSGRGLNTVIKGWPVCSEECHDFFQRKINRKTREREIQWEEILQSRRILREAKLLLKNQLNQPQDHSLSQSEV